MDLDYIDKMVRLGHFFPVLINDGQVVGVDNDKEGHAKTVFYITPEATQTLPQAQGTD